MAHLERLSAGLLFLALAACSARGDDAQGGGVSEDLLSAESDLSDHVTVADDRLEVDGAGHDEVLGYPQGKILVGGPSSREDSVRNPYGFLRRIEKVYRAGDKIVIETSKASLTDAFKGDVTISNSGELSPVDEAGNLKPQAGWSGTITKRIDLPSNKSLLNQKITRGPMTWDVGVKLDHGFLDFTPSISTNIELGGASLKQVKVVATGDLGAELALDVNVKATDSSPEASRDFSDLQHFEAEIYSFPRKRWLQWVGFVPVWEALEVRVLLRCDIKARGDLTGDVGFSAKAHVAAGGEYKKGQGLSPILDGPTFEMSPQWDIQTAGSFYGKCGLLPQVGLFVYDLAGPTLTVGPWFESNIATQAQGPATWTLQPGFHADFGARGDVFGYYTLFDEHVTLLDKPLGSMHSGTF